MTLLEGWDHLAAEIGALVDLPITDHVLGRKTSVPGIAIVPESSGLSAHGAGSDLTGEHYFSLWILVPHENDYRSARESLYSYVLSLCSIPRFYVSEGVVEYGEDMVGNVPCVLARLVGKVA